MKKLKGKGKGKEAAECLPRELPFIYFAEASTREISSGPLKLELTRPALSSETTLCFSSRELGTQSPVTHHSCVAHTAHTSRSKMASAPSLPPSPSPAASGSDTLRECVQLHLEHRSQEPVALRPPSLEHRA